MTTRLDEILDVIVVPRENGSAALADVGGYLERTARAASADVSLHRFVCYPHAPEILGLLALGLAFLFVVFMWRRRFGWALSVALILPFCLWSQSPMGAGLLNGFGAAPEQNVIAHFSVPQPERTVILGAHYDTRTDFFDYYQRLPIQSSIVPVLLLTAWLPVSAFWRHWRRRPPGRVRIWAFLVFGYFTAFFLMMGGGEFLSGRSVGAVDNGGSVAVLMRLVERLGAGELELKHTDVEVVLFAGTEVGLQGSRRYVAERLSPKLVHPLYFINLEGWGFGSRLSFLTSDRLPLRRVDASPHLVRTLDLAYRRLNPRVGLVPDVQPMTTDANSFGMAGIPSVTLGSQRGSDSMLGWLHSARDERKLIVPGALEQALAFLEAGLMEIDTRGVESEPEGLAGGGN